jgi:dCTP deaminase
VSLLSDRDIISAIDDGLLEITPFSSEAVRPASVDLRLGALVTIADPNEPDDWRVHDLRARPFRLDRGTFILAHTLERVRLGDPTRPETCTLAGILAGKSSRAREGIQVEAAGYVDPGWDGELTIEVTRFRPGTSILTLGMPICQIRCETLYSHALRPYGSDATSHYQHSRGPVLSRTTGGVP